MTSWKFWAAAAAIALAVFALMLPAPRADAVAAVFPPWWTQQRAIKAAVGAGEVLGAGGAGFVVIVRAPSRAARQQLHRAGALALLDPTGFAPCGEQGTPNV